MSYVYKSDALFGYFSGIVRVPAGWLGDKNGVSRNGLAGLMAMYSGIVTIVSIAFTNFTTMIIYSFLFGIGGGLIIHTERYRKTQMYRKTCTDTDTETIQAFVLNSFWPIGAGNHSSHTHVEGYHRSQREFFYSFLETCIICLNSRYCPYC